MGDLFGSIIDSIGGAVVSALESFVVWLYQLIVVVFQALYQVIGFVYNFFLSIVQAIGKFFDHLWNAFFKGIFTGLWSAIKAGWQWLERELAALNRIMTKLRAWLQRYYNQYIRPQLQMIQKLRQYLQILSLLHISFAQKLDAYLAQLQAKIVQSYATIIGTINTLVDITNALADPRYLIRKPALLLSLRRQIPALIAVCTGKPPGYWFPSPKGSAGGPFKAPAFPFNFADPSQNPPPSSYLATDDGIDGVAAPADGFTFLNSSIDQAQPLDYFDDSLYPASPCTDPAQCLAKALGMYVQPSS